MAESLSRVEAILENTLGYGTELPKPQSRVENLLVELKDAIDTGGVTVDTQMDPESTNPVANGAIYDFVNSSVSTNTADFKGTFSSLAELQAVTDANNNDYGFVVGTDADGNTVYNRYKFNGSAWEFEYALNNSSFTAAQWATIQSGLTAADKTKLNGIESGANKTVVDSSLSNSSTNPLENRAVYNALSGKASQTDMNAAQNAISNLQTGWAVFNTYNKPVVYGYRINADNTIDYLADAVGKTPAAMGASTFNYGDWQDAFFMPKPCMLKSDTTVAYYLDPNDYSKKTDGTASDVADTSFDGNAMMEWGIIYSKFYQIGDEKYFLCSNVNVDGKFRCDNNIDARGRITPHFYTAIYNGTGTDKLRSISGVVLTSANGNGNTNVTQEVTRATANNTTSNVEWYTSVWVDERLIDALLILIGNL